MFKAKLKERQRKRGNELDKRPKTCSSTPKMDPKVHQTINVLLLPAQERAEEEDR